jgi:hypothetical protein
MVRIYICVYIYVYIVTNMVLARKRLSKHFPAETDSWQTVSCWATQMRFPWIRCSQCVLSVMRTERL